MGPTFSADLRKSLFAHFVLLLLLLPPFAVDEAGVFEGDSLFGAGGGKDFVLGDFCFDNAAGGLFDFDLLLFVALDAVFVTLLRDEADDDFDVTELSRDFDGLFSPFSGDSLSRDDVFDGEALLPLLSRL